MGSTLSEPIDPPPTPQNRVKSQLSYLEKQSLYKNIEEMNGDESLLVDKLGLAHTQGYDLIIRMAHNLVDGEIFENMEFIICYFDQRLRKPLKIDCRTFWRSIFDSLTCENRKIGDERFILYEDLVTLWQILLSAIDLRPTDLDKDVEPIGPQCELVLCEYKSPAITFNHFVEIVEKQPFIFKGLGNIWDRLLNDKITSKPNEEAEEIVCIGNERWISNLLYSILGPILDDRIRLFSGKRNGFSMQAFEQKVTKWPAPSLLLVKGHQTRDYINNWKPKNKKADKIVPQFYDSPMIKRKHVILALFVDTPWKKSYKNCFGSSESLLIQIKPTFRVFNVPTKSVFFTPKLGLGSGFIKPPSMGDNTLGSVLYIDDSMDSGVLRVSSKEKFECRFYVDEVEVDGCGDQQDLAEQTKEWAWEDREAHRRRNINIQEDRAILRMAGLIKDIHR